MTKLEGTSGQVFAGLAESLTRGVSRSAKGTGAAGAKSADDSSFNDLLHTVSTMAKRALNDQGSDATAKAGSLRPRLAQLTERDTPNDDTVHERTEAADESKKSDKSSDKQSSIDQVAKADVQSRLGLPAILGQELTVAPAVTPQTQLPSNKKNDMSARDERSPATRREVQGTNVTQAAATDVARSAAAASNVSLSTTSPSTASRSAVSPSNISPSAVVPTSVARSTVARSTAAPSGARSQAAASPTTAAQRATATEQTMSSEDGAQPDAMPGTPGFEAVTANVERAAKASSREALPEATKVTVVQQETHLPPVSQFSATQQVANAVVSELKGSPAAASSAVADLAASQSNAPDQPLKILTVNLEPQALGNVTVRLRLVGSEVSIHLAAERKDTSLMLDQQRDSIRNLMQSAGYVAEVAPVQHGSLDGFQTGSGQSQPQLPGQQQQSPQSQGAFGGAGTSSGQSDGGARQARQEQQPNQEARHDQDVAPQIRRGPVYL
jgi:chemotaxis protein MotD